MAHLVAVTKVSDNWFNFTVTYRLFVSEDKKQLATQSICPTNYSLQIQVTLIVYKPATKCAIN